MSAAAWNAWLRHPGNVGRWCAVEGGITIGDPVHLDGDVASRCACDVRFMQGVVAEIQARECGRVRAFILFRGRTKVELEGMPGHPTLYRVRRFIPEMPTSIDWHLSTDGDPHASAAGFEPPRSWTPEADQDAGDASA